MTEPQRQDAPEERWNFGEPSELRWLPPGGTTLALGGFAFAVAAAAWLPILSWLAWIDLPLNLTLFLICAYAALVDLRETMRALPGLLLAAAAITGAVLHLLVDRAHPWVE